MQIVRCKCGHEFATTKKENIQCGKCGERFDKKMKINKAPLTHYFKEGWVSFHKDRKTSELYYEISNWKDHILSPERIKGKVKDEQHLKELQSYTEIRD